MLSVNNTQFLIAVPHTRFIAKKIRRTLQYIATIANRRRFEGPVTQS
ncbi:MAG: hypothetical protein ACI9OF_002310 [Saprospiraceae bacterium]